LAPLPIFFFFANLSLAAVGFPRSFRRSTARLLVPVPLWHLKRVFIYIAEQLFPARPLGPFLKITHSSRGLFCIVFFFFSFDPFGCCNIPWVQIFTFRNSLGCPRNLLFLEFLFLRPHWFGVVPVQPLGDLIWFAKHFPPFPVSVVAGSRSHTPPYYFGSALKCIG